MDEHESMLLFKDKQAKLILALADGTKEWYLSNLAKSANVTYIHTSRFVTKCEKVGIMSSEVHGKIKRVYLTDKGKEIANGISSILSKINEKPTEQQQQQQPK